MKQMHPSVLTVATLTILAVAIAVVFEIGAVACASATMFWGYGLFWTIVLAPFLLRCPSRVKCGLYVGLIVCLAILYIVPWSSRKSFLRALGRVQIGMTADEVQNIMGRYIKGTGWPAIPSTTSHTGLLVNVGSGVVMATSVSASGELEIQDSMTYRHSNEPAFNSDWGIVKFKNGKVVAKLFMPD